MMRASALLLLAAITVVGLTSSAGASSTSESLWSRGLAALQKGDGVRALALLDRALEADPKDGRARFYRGMARRSVGDLAGAAEDFRAVAAADHGGDPIAARAAEELERTLAASAPDRATQSEPTARETQAASRFSLRASAALEYDSNIELAPDDASVRALYGIDEDHDGRVAMRARAGYVLYHSPLMEVVAAYEPEQSVHFSVEESDLQVHRASLAMTGAHSALSWGGLGSYDFQLVDEKEFLSEVVLSPWLSWAQGHGASLALAYRFALRDFCRQPFGSLLDGNLQSVALIESFDLGSQGSRLDVGYRFDRVNTDHTDGASLENNAHTIAAAVLWMLPWGLEADAAYAWRDSDYDDASLGRDDSEHRVRVGVARGLGSLLRLRVAQEAYFHGSDRQSFQYQRYVTSAVLEARY